MADLTAEPPASAEAGNTTPANVAQTSAATAATAEAAEATGAAALANLSAEVTMGELMEAGVHFGHQTHRWNPRMKSYLFGERNGVHIIDLDQTLPRFRESLDFIRDIVAGGGKVLFVGTKRQTQAPIKFEAERANQYFVNNRWLGGMLTNFKTVKKSIERFKNMLEILGDEEKSAELSKKDLARTNRQVEKYRKSLDGIREMSRLPQALFIIDVNCESIAVKEARRLSIPIIAVVDSNCDPMDIGFAIPGNDDSIRAIQLFCSKVANACLEGEAIHNDRIQSEEAEKEKAKAPSKGEKGGTRPGRVVVEIKHPPRRGRGAALAAEKRESERETKGAEAPAAGGRKAKAAEAPAAGEQKAVAAEAPAAGARKAKAAEVPAAGEQKAEVAEAPAAGEQKTEVAEAPAEAKQKAKPADAPAEAKQKAKPADAPAAEPEKGEDAAPLEAPEGA
jgi:small subunit ribosomal protein S2